MSIDMSAMQIDKLRNEFIERVRRYDDCTYIYTYPFKGAYRPIADHKTAIQTWNFASGPINIYVHIPYCDMKCGFCNLFTTTQYSIDTFRHYTQSVLAEATLLANQIDGKRFEVDSLYFGGGTPTLLSSPDIKNLIEGLRNLFQFRPTVEFAIESAPNSVDVKKLQELRALGFQRMSFGIQSFEDTELIAMGRDYESSLGYQMVSSAITTGFQNVNVDLIFGLPKQTLQTWLQNLETAVSLGIETITIYPLTLRSRTAFGKAYTRTSSNYARGVSLYSFYDMAVDFLTTHGYTQCTMVSFAKQNGGCRHEINEFMGIPTLGFGAAALTYGPTVHYTSGHYFEQLSTSQVLSDYIQSIEQHILPIRCGFFLDRNELQRKYLILGLLSSGVDRGEYIKKFNEAIETSFSVQLKILEEEGCLSEMNGRLFLSPRGRKFSSLVAEFLSSENVMSLAASYR